MDKINGKWRERGASSEDPNTSITRGRSCIICLAVLLGSIATPDYWNIYGREFDITVGSSKSLWKIHQSAVFHSRRRNFWV